MHFYQQPDHQHQQRSVTGITPPCSVPRWQYFKSIYYWFAPNTTKYKTRLGRYAVPLFIYDPTGNLKGKNSNLFQHVDISTTILSLVGNGNKMISFGNNAFSSNDKFAVQYVNGTYQIATKDNFLIFDGQKTSNFYDLKTDSLLAINLIGNLSLEQNIKKEKTEKFLKGIIQQYNNRLINNQLSTSNQQNH